MYWILNLSLLNLSNFVCCFQKKTIFIKKCVLKSSLIVNLRLIKIGNDLDRLSRLCLPEFRLDESANRPVRSFRIGGGGWHISKKNEDLIIFVYFTNCMGVRKEGQVGQLTPLALYVFLVKMYLGNFHQKLLAAVILTASCNQKGLF